MLGTLSLTHMGSIFKLWDSHEFHPIKEWVLDKVLKIVSIRP